MTTTDVVIGGGLAAARAVETLRESGSSTDLVLIGEESDAPYERPELSKGFLAGKTGREELDVRPASWYAEHEVRLLLGRRAVRLDRSAREVELEDGERVGYTRLLLATGSAPVRPSLPGADLAGALLLRRVGDSEAIRTAIAGGGPLVVLGTGWIGLEVAAVARDAGAEVTLLGSGPAPLHRVVGERVGATFTDLHRRHGVDVRNGVTVTAIHGREGKVTGVELADGTRLPASAVILGTGARPRLELARDAGLPVDRGVLVDATLRTEDPAIWAAGDIAEAENAWADRRVRVEHFQNAADQGRFAARSMAGSDARWAEPPFFWSDQYDVGLEYRGLADPERDRVVVRGEPGSGPWQAFWLDRENRVVAGMHVNAWDEADQVKRFVTDRVTVDPSALADAARPLEP